MTPEEEARESRINAAQKALRAALPVIPFDLNKADATRIDVWKQLRFNIEKMLRRNVREPSRYEDALRSLRALRDQPLDVIVKGVYEDKEGKKP